MENEEINEEVRSIDKKEDSFFNKARQIRLVKFTTVSLIGWGLNEFIIFLMFLLLDHFTSQTILFSIWFYKVEKIILAQFVAIIFVTVYNYLVNKIWTFRKQEQQVNFNNIKQFIKYAIVGASGALINLGLVHLFTITIGWNKYIGTTIGFVVSVITNFILNDLWTFNPRFGTLKNEMKEDV